MTGPDARTANDRCPGVFAPHPAADGFLARIRLLGGSIRPDQMQTLARVCAQYGDGHLELTGRGNIQIRGINDVDAVADELTAAGLVPSTISEKIRNIEVSAATGRVGGLADVWPLARDLDAALRADADLARLSGRFLFGIDDGRADILGRAPDAAVVLRALPGALTCHLVIDGVDLGAIPGAVITPGAELDTIAPSVTAHLVAVARDMIDLAVDTRAWRIRDLDGARRSDLLARARGRLDRLIPESSVGPDAPASDAVASDAVASDAPAPDTAAPDPAASDVSGHEPLVGWFAQHDSRVLLGAVVELGRFPARLAEFLAAIDAPIVITPDREILVCDLTEAVAETVVRVLAPMGLIFDASSPWALLSCCVGAPGCGNAQAPVREDLLARVASAPVTEREHWVGCARGCGSPTQRHLRVEASASGYRTEPRSAPRTAAAPQ